MVCLRLHEVVMNRLKKELPVQRTIHIKQIRMVLGLRCRIPKNEQVNIISELVNVGLMAKETKEKYKIL